MPSLRDLQNQMDKIAARLRGQREARKQRQEKEVSLLPKDLTGQVFSRCREEAARVRDRIAWLNTEIEELKIDIREAETRVKAASAPVMIPGKLKGDILDGFEVTLPKPDPGRMIITEEALKIRRKEVFPRRARLLKLERERDGRLVELHDLKKIATMAAQGDVALIHHLSSKWAGRLELGAGTEGVIAKYKGQVGPLGQFYTDAAGIPLPAEALKNGEPDLPNVPVAAEERSALVIQLHTPIR